MADYRVSGEPRRIRQEICIQLLVWGCPRPPSAIKHRCVGALWKASCEAAKLAFQIHQQQNNRHGLKARALLRRGTDSTTTPQLIHRPPALLALFVFFFTIFGCEQCHFLVLLHCDCPTSSLAAAGSVDVFCCVFCRVELSNGKSCCWSLCKINIVLIGSFSPNLLYNLHVLRTISCEKMRTDRTQSCFTPQMD